MTRSMYCKVLVSSVRCGNTATTKDGYCAKHDPEAIVLRRALMKTEYARELRDKLNRFVPTPSEVGDDHDD